MSIDTDAYTDTCLVTTGCVAASMLHDCASV
jgi:hypothetical protein